MTDPATIAKGLTKAQKIALLHITDEITFKTMAELYTMRLMACGDPTALGRRVAAHLRNTETGDGDASDT